MEKRVGRVPPHRLAFWAGACLVGLGLLSAVLARYHGQTTVAQGFGFVLIIAGFVAFSIAWHLVGKQVGDAE